MFLAFSFHVYHHLLSVMSLTGRWEVWNQKKNCSIKNKQKHTCSLQWSFLANTIKYSIFNVICVALFTMSQSSLKEKYKFEL